MIGHSTVAKRCKQVEVFVEADMQHRGPSEYHSCIDTFASPGIPPSSR